MEFYLTKVSRINRGGETVDAVNGVFNTDNKEIIDVARAMWATFNEENKEEPVIDTPKRGRKKNA